MEAQRTAHTEILLELAADDPRIRVLENPRRRTASGLNVCLREARGEFVARMDAHTFYSDRYLAAGVERLLRRDTEWVSGPAIPRPVGAISRAVALALASWLGRGGSRKWSEDLTSAEEQSLDTGVFGGVWRRVRLLEAGGWDERWPINQDSEMASRFLARGAHLVCLPEMAGYYVPRDSLEGLARQYYRYGFYRVRTFARHPQQHAQIPPDRPGVDGRVIASVGAPRPLRRLSRAGLFSYAAAVIATGASTAARSERPGDGALLLVVLPVMHFGWGFGTLAGMLRFGPPLSALARLAGWLGRADRSRDEARPSTRLRCTARAPELAPRGLHRLRVLLRWRASLRAARVRRLPRGAAPARRSARCSSVASIRDRARPHYPLHEDTELVGLPHYESLSQPWLVARSLLVSLVRFWRLLDEVDTVWVLGPYPHSVALALLTALRGRRLVLGTRQDMPLYVRSRRPDKRWMHASADVLEAIWKLLARRYAVVVVGPELERKYRDGGARRVLATTVSLVSERDLALAADAVAARYYDGELTVLTVGRLDAEKNPLLLVDIIARLLAGGRRWRLLICGEGPMRPQLEQRIAELGLGEHVELLGYVPVEGGLLDLYRTSHAFLHVSWTEGFPQVLVEAFASGLPTVATAVGGVPAAVGDAALLIEPDDADAAAESLERIATDAQLRVRLIDAGLARAQDGTLETSTRRLAEFLSTS